MSKDIVALLHDLDATILIDTSKYRWSIFCLPTGWAAYKNTTGKLALVPWEVIMEPSLEALLEKVRANVKGQVVDELQGMREATGPH